ncbi:hypothetical protein Poly59_07440 [Rubripirellula reticaptiva]|uniref:Uncharacterized protein n=1 Tax=Rubripirellula reticaptiva TaxID=2528013 RepID=A0A5C6F905_9BACT|nr:hypothetical protein Poly59_07440 [Rubripirellula reticaptiva]
MNRMCLDVSNWKTLEGRVIVVSCQPDLFPVVAARHLASSLAAGLHDKQKGPKQYANAQQEFHERKTLATYLGESIARVHFGTNRQTMGSPMGKREHRYGPTPSTVVTEGGIRRGWLEGEREARRWLSR